MDFHRGDRVRVRTDYPGASVIHGQGGTVVKVTRSRWYPIVVQLDGPLPWPHSGEPNRFAPGELDKVSD